MSSPIFPRLRLATISRRRTASTGTVNAAQIHADQPPRSDALAAKPRASPAAGIAMSTGLRMAAAAGPPVFPGSVVMVVNCGCSPAIRTGCPHSGKSSERSSPAPANDPATRGRLASTGRFRSGEIRSCRRGRGEALPPHPGSIPRHSIISQIWVGSRSHTTGSAIVMAATPSLAKVGPALLFSMI